jgi:hypothetical protein
MSGYTATSEILDTLGLLAKSGSSVRLWMSVDGLPGKDANDGRPMSAADAITFIEASQSVMSEFGREVGYMIRREVTA